MQQQTLGVHPTARTSPPIIPPNAKGWMRGIALTAVLAILSGQIASLPFFSIMGIMIISIILGMCWKATMGVPADAAAGITFSSKYVLRIGIVLMGLRLNLSQIFEGGVVIVAIDAIVIACTLAIMIGLGRKLGVEPRLAALLAVGTAVCGAAAIVAVAPLIGAKKETTAISIACIAILGTVGALSYIFLFPYLGLDSYSYGVFAGATLHELAHVIAAGVPGGELGSDTAIVVKLGRVALLIPVAILLGYIYRAKTEREQSEKKRWTSLPIPWFIFGFLAMSVVNTVGVLPDALLQFLISSSVFLMSAAMAGLGLGIKLEDFKKVGKSAIIVAISGFVALAGLVAGLLWMFF